MENAGLSISPKDLCEILIHVDSEDEVVSTLEDAGFWDSQIVGAILATWRTTSRRRVLSSPIPLLHL